MYALLALLLKHMHTSMSLETPPPTTTTTSVYLSLSQEVSGDGAKAVASLLTARGVTFDFVLDEGLMVLNGVVPSHEKPVAMVGVVEKVGRHSAG
jgi:hypothetical protein